MASELESGLQDTVGCGRKWLVDFNAGKKQLLLSDQSSDSGAIFVKLDWGSVAKTASRKIGALICCMKFLSPEVVLHLCKSTI